MNTPGLWRVNSPWDEAEQFLLRERLQKIIGGFDVWGGNYFISEAPYTAHVDAGKNLGFATYKNVVMPLMIEPPGASTHFILFKQRYFGNSSSFYAAPRKKPIKHGYNEILQDYSRVYDLNEASPIDPEIMNTYLKHIKPADLNGLSVSHILPWKVGTCIIFDASQIHCSAAYTHGGVGKKMGLSLFTRKLPEAGIKPPTM